MSDIKDGGPAFPGVGHANNVLLPGMSLRDWFAGQALAAIFSFDQTETPGEVAKLAYQHADAMLAARQKGREA